jgi:hypothetical protein
MPPGAHELYPAETVPEVGGDRPAEAGARLRVVLWDERLSSWEASRLVEGDDAGRRRSRDGRAIDAHAAAVILQSFLDSHEREGQDQSQTAAQEDTAYRPNI